MTNKLTPENQGNFEAKEEDSMIKAALSSLKDIKIPPDLRASNQRSIDEALAETSDSSRSKGIFWWHKRISIPLPIAAGFLLVFCLQLILQSYNLTTYSQTPKTTRVSDTMQNSIGLSEKSSESYYSEHGVYVAGIGFIEKSKSYDYFKENDHENKL